MRGCSEWQPSAVATSITTEPGPSVALPVAMLRHEALYVREAGEVGDVSDAINSVSMQVLRFIIVLLLGRLTTH